MAEIHIVRKRPSALWLALVGIALLLLAIWALWSVLGDDEAVDATVDAAGVATVDEAYGANAPIAVPGGETAEQSTALLGEPNAVGPVGEAVPTPVEPAAPTAAAIAVPVERQPGVQPSAEFVVPDVNAKATPIEARLRSPYVGQFVSDSITLFVRDDGNYEITRSAAGPGRGPWTVLREHNVLFLDPADGSQDRYFRIEGPDTLVPLNPRGRQPAQMTELLRRQPDAAAGR